MADRFRMINRQVRSLGAFGPSIFKPGRSPEAARMDSVGGAT
jgi:hypothetical protein